MNRIKDSHQAKMQGLQQQLQQASAKLAAAEQQGQDAASRVTQLQAQVAQLQTQLAAKPTPQAPSGDLSSLCRAVASRVAGG